MRNLKDIAKKATTLAEIMNGRDKIDTEEIIDTYEDGITIDNIELCLMVVDGEQVNVWIYTFEEDKKHFAFAGYVLAKIFNQIVEECDGDLEKAYAEVKKQTLSVRLSTGKTKSKQPITLVEVL